MLRLLGSAAALIAITIIIVLSLTDGRKSKYPGAQQAPSPALATQPASPSSSLSTSQPSGTESSVILVEVATGRSLPLAAEPQGVAGIASFTRDSRSLLFDSQAKASAASIYKVDLEAPVLEPVRLIEGLFPQPGASGAIAFARPDKMAAGHPGGASASRLAVLKADGRTEILEPPGGLWAWSPDGRWLAFIEQYTVGKVERVVGVYDAMTDRTRVIETVEVQGTDYRVWPEWAPDSRAFSFRAQPTGRRAVSPYGDFAPTDVPTGAWWGPDSRKVYDVWPAEIVEITVRTGAKRTLSTDAYVPFVASAGRALPLNRDAQPFSVPAERYRWSLEGRLTLDEFCVQEAVGGRQVLCLDGATGAEFSPDASSIAFVRSRTLDARPRAFAPPSAHDTTSDLFVLDLVTGQERRILNDVRGATRCITWSPDGRWLVLGGYCGGV
jgi:WD40-like Beta Propeller Repeat